MPDTEFTISIDLLDVRSILAAHDATEQLVEKAAVWWAIDLGSHVVRLVDFTPDRVQMVASQFHGSPTKWREVVNDPLSNLDAARTLVGIAAEMRGVASPGGELSIFTLTQFFTRVAIDLPDPVEVPASGVDPTGETTTPS